MPPNGAEHYEPQLDYATDQVKLPTTVTNKADAIDEDWGKHESSIQKVEEAAAKLKGQIDFLEEFARNEENPEGARQEAEARAAELRVDYEGLKDRHQWLIADQQRVIDEDVDKQIDRSDRRLGRRAERKENENPDVLKVEEKEAERKAKDQLLKSTDAELKKAEEKLAEMDPMNLDDIEDAVENEDYEKQELIVEGLRIQLRKLTGEIQNLDKEIGDLMGEQEDIKDNKGLQRRSAVDEFWDKKLEGYEKKQEDAKARYEALWGEAYVGPEDAGDGGEDLPGLDDDGMDTDQGGAEAGDDVDEGEEGDLEGGDDVVESNEVQNVHAAFDNLSVSLIRDLIKRPAKPDSTVLEKEQLPAKGRMLLLRFVLVGSDEQSVHDLLGAGDLDEAKTYLGMNFEKSEDGKSMLIKFDEPDYDAIQERWEQLSDKDKGADETGDLDVGVKFMDELSKNELSAPSMIIKSGLSPDAKFTEFLTKVKVGAGDKISEELEATLESNTKVSLGDVVGEYYRRGIASDNAETREAFDTMKTSLIAHDEQWTATFEEKSGVTDTTDNPDGADTPGEELSDLDPKDHLTDILKFSDLDAEIAKHGFDINTTMGTYLKESGKLDEFKGTPFYDALADNGTIDDGEAAVILEAIFGDAKLDSAMEALDPMLDQIATREGKDTEAMRTEMRDAFSKSMTDALKKIFDTPLDIFLLTLGAASEDPDKRAKFTAAAAKLQAAGQTPTE